MAFWFTLFLWIATTAIGVAFQPRPPRQRRQKPVTLETPMAEEDRPIPVVLGTMVVRNPNVLWFGDVRTVVDANTISGLKFYMGAHLGICVAIPRAGFSTFKVTGIIANDVRIPRASVVVDATNNVVGFDTIDPGPRLLANIVPTTYYSHLELAENLQIQMDITAQANGFPAGDWKIVFGFQVATGINDTFSYSTTFGGVTTTRFVIIPTSGVTDYHPDELAATLQDLLTAQQAGVGGGPDGSFTVTYSGSTNKFTIAFTPIKAGFTQFRLEAANGAGLDSGANALLGFAIHATTIGAGSPSTIISLFTRFEDRFTFVRNNATGGIIDPAAGGSAGAAGAALFGVTARLDMPASGATKRWEGAEGAPDNDIVTWYIKATDIFGAEGSLVGRLIIYQSPSARPGNWYLKTQIGAALPRWKKLCYAVMQGMEIGFSNYPKPLAFEVEAVPYDYSIIVPDVIGQDINPALAIYAALVDGVWGRGLPEAALDGASFEAAATVLSGEGFGVSLQLDDASSTADFIEEVLRHVDGVLYTNTVTGLLAITLARDDYDPGAIPVYDESVISDLQFSRPSWEETRNMMKVRYLDRASGYVEKVEKVDDLANLAARGGEQSFEEISFPMVTTQANAKQVANRALRALSRPLASMSFTIDRTGWALQPGSVFSLTWADLGITAMPCRVTRVTGGSPSDGRITVDAVEDAFGAAWTQWTQPTT